MIIYRSFPINYLFSSTLLNWSGNRCEWTVTFHFFFFSNIYRMYVPFFFKIKRDCLLDSIHIKKNCRIYKKLTRSFFWEEDILIIYEVCQLLPFYKWTSTSQKLWQANKEIWRGIGRRMNEWKIKWTVYRLDNEKCYQSICNIYGSTGQGCMFRCMYSFVNIRGVSLSFSSILWPCLSILIFFRTNETYDRTVHRIACCTVAFIKEN